MKKNILLGLVACVALAACEKETRKGVLELTGSQPLRVVDQESGKAVDFVSGPLKAEFGANGSKFSATLEQNGRKAKFSGRIPRDSWSFSLRGSEIKQAFDLESKRKIELYGEVRTRIGDGGPCGMNGTWMTEEKWQSCNEDWKVGFSSGGQSIGTFASRLEAQSCLIDTRNLVCRGQHREPRDRPSVKNQALEKLEAQVQSGVKFD
jgi:hypothetical protein